MTMQTANKIPTATNVSEFLTKILALNRKTILPVAFRGQSFTGWPTQAKIFRSEVGIYNHEKEAIRDLMSIHPSEFKDDQTMFDRLVRMQHFDLPTRLLDVTYNPLVALYFATGEYRKDNVDQAGKVQAFFLPEDRRKYFDSDRVSCIANLSNLTQFEKSCINDAFDLSKGEFHANEGIKRLVWFVQLEKPNFQPRINPFDLKLPVYVKPKMSNRRIIAQSGAFIIFGTQKPSLQPDDPDLKIFRIVIPADKKRLIRSELFRLGIDASTLFPEIDKAAAMIVDRYRSA